MLGAHAKSGRLRQQSTDVSNSRDMSHSRSAGQESAGTNREYKFKDECDAPQSVPESWAANGVHETDGEQFYAVQIRTGRRYEWTVNHAGTLIAGPHSDEPAIETLYVTADGSRCVVVESKAIQSGSTSIVPHDEWRSVVADPTKVSEIEAAEDRELYRLRIAELYDVDGGHSDE